MNTYTSEEVAALEILRGTGVNIVEAALVARSALEAGRNKVKRTLKCVALGAEELKRQEKTVSFEKAVAEALAARKERRAGICWKPQRMEAGRIYLICIRILLKKQWK